MIFEAVKPEIISQELVQANTRDISVNGLSFVSELPLAEGDQLQLTLQIPSQPVNALGWVGFVANPIKADLWWRWSSFNRRTRSRNGF